MTGRWREWRWLAAGLVALDILGIGLAFRLAFDTRLVWQFVPYNSAYDARGYLEIALASVPVWLAILAAHRLYDRRVLLAGVREYSLIVNACTYGVLVVALLAFLWRRETTLSRGWLLAVWPCSIVILGSLRFLARRVAQRLRSRGLFVRRVIVAGANDEGVSLAASLSPARLSGVEVVGFVDDYLAPGSVVGHGSRVLGESSSLPELAAAHQADLVIVVSGALAWEGQQLVVQLAVDDRTPFEVRLLPGLDDLVGAGVSADDNGLLPLVSIRPTRITGIDRLLKGALDYGGAALALVFTAPLLALLVAVSARRYGPGGLLEAREYLGVRGRPFRTVAFRGWWSADPGDRVSRLRARRLHRLPALLNVLRGEMSLVGPRRVTVDDLARQPRLRRSLLSIKPGLTGPWLLAGGERLTLEESLRLDLHYARHYSIWLDLQILSQTLRHLLVGFGPDQPAEPETLDARPQSRAPEHAGVGGPG